MLIARLDYELIQRFTLTVIARDGGGEETTGRVRINGPTPCGTPTSTPVGKGGMSEGDDLCPWPPTSTPQSPELSHSLMISSEQL